MSYVCEDATEFPYISRSEQSSNYKAMLDGITDVLIKLTRCISTFALLLYLLMYILFVLKYNLL